MLKKLTEKRLALGLALGLLPFAGLVQLSRSHQGTRVLSHYFGGRAADCTLRESFEAGALARLQVQNFNDIRSSGRVLRKDEHYSLWSTPLGEFWMSASSGDPLMFDLAEQKRNIYGTGIRAGDTVLDAGANVGVFTRKALLAGAAKVIAIEPAPENVECLRRNFAAEIADGRVVVYAKGIWDKDDVLKMSIDPSNSAADSFVATTANAHFIELPLTTIDNLVQDLRLHKVDFIKMDIEGAEPRAVRGARKTIAGFRPRMALCVYHNPGDATVVPKLVHDIVADYKVTRTCVCLPERIQPEVAFFN